MQIFKNKFKNTTTPFLITGINEGSYKYVIIPKQ